MKFRFLSFLFTCLTLVGFAQEPEQPDFEIPRYTVEFEAVRSLAQVLDYWHPLMETDQAWVKNRGEGAVVFILDTGQNPHPDLSQNGQQYNFNTTPEPMADGNGHGSYCAGVIASQDNTFGALGVSPDAIIVSGKVMRNNGTGSSTEIAAGIRKAADIYAATFPDKIGILSMSFGGGSPMPDVEQALLYAVSKGMVLVASAGNSGYPGQGNTIGWPARYDFVNSVAALDQQSKPAQFSSGGEGLDVTAYGVSIYSTNQNQGYARVSGTSFSGPMIAGVCALIGTQHRAALLAGDRTKINERVSAHLKKYATDLEGAGWDSRTGYGVAKATVVNNPLPDQGGVEPPQPPGKLRTVNVTVPGEYTMFWRAADKEQFENIRLKFEVEYQSTYPATKAHSVASGWIGSFFVQRGFVLLAGDDEWEALFWARHFAEMISKAQGFPIVCARITATNEAGQVFTLAGNQRRQGAQSKAVAGVTKGVRMQTFDGE